MFTIFYTATVTIPFVVSIAYWLVLHRFDHMIDQGSKGDALYRFLLISTTMLNSLIAFVEVMFLNSVRKQKVLTLSLRELTLLMLLGSGHPRRQSHCCLPPIRHVDSLWLFYHGPVCV